MSYWRKCGTCKKEIGFNSPYQRCSISSCRKFAYCSVDCWSLHDSVMGHKNAHAEEVMSPASEEAPSPTRRRIVSSSPSNASKQIEKDILIVASKLKKYIKDRHDMNTSANVMDKLSDLVRDLCDDAVIRARQEGRKTLMDRDF